MPGTAFLLPTGSDPGVPVRVRERGLVGFGAFNDGFEIPTGEGREPFRAVRCVVLPWGRLLRPERVRRQGEYPAPDSAYRFLITSVRRAIGRNTPCSF